MAKIEIEDTELAALQRVHKVAETMLANPKTRTEFLKLQKVITPDAVIPELDATANVMTAVKGVEEKLNGLMKSLDDDQQKRAEDSRTRELAARVTAGQDYLVKAGYNAEGVAKIEALMLSESIGSYAAGLALFERLNPPARPSEGSTSRWGDMSGNDVQTDDYKELWDSQGRSENWLQNSIENVRKDFRN